MTFFWQNSVGSLQANAQFYVYEMSRGRLSHELGPYDLDTARQYGRIAASRGSHDRVVTRGRDGPIVKRYAAGSGAPLMANQAAPLEHVARGAELLRDRYEWQAVERDGRRGRVGLDWNGGRRWARLYFRDPTGSKSVISFVDKHDGSIYPPESWKKPNKRRSIGSVLDLLG